MCTEVLYVWLYIYDKHTCTQILNDPAYINKNARVNSLEAINDKWNRNKIKFLLKTFCAKINVDIFVFVFIWPKLWDFKFYSSLKPTKY